MKYFIYCRVSQEAEDRQVLSPESQKKELLAYAIKHKLNIVDIYCERKSAYKTGRIEFNEMLSRIKKGEANGILVYHLSRIARNSFDGGNVIYMMDEKYIKEIRTKEKIYTNCSDDKFLMQIHFAMNKKSSDDTSAFIKRDTVTKLKKGEYYRMAPYGYLNINKEGVISGKGYKQEKQELLAKLGRPLRRIEKDPLIAPIIRTVFELASTGQFSLKQLQKKSFEQGLLNKNLKPISVSNLCKMLNNRFYYGDMIYHGKSYLGNHDPIITRAEYDKLQEILFNRSRPQSNRKEYVFSMLVPCPQCNKPMSSDTQKGYEYLRCTYAKKGKCSFKNNIRQDRLEDDVLMHLKLIQLPKELESWLNKWLKAQYEENLSKDKLSQKQIQKNISLMEVKLKKLMDKWVAPENVSGQYVSDQDYLEMRKSIDTQIKTLRKQLSQAKENPDLFYKCCKGFLIYLPSW